MLLWGLLWIIGMVALVLVGIGYAATIPLMRRRPPDAPDHPTLYGMPCEDVTFASRDGLQIGGWWIPAQSPTGTVILCPGQNGSMDKDVPQAVPLHKAGFNVLMFDFRAHGRSEGQYVTIGALEQADLLGAVDFLAAQKGITRVGVLGFSMGAGVALMAAAQEPKIAALVVDGAWPRLDRLVTRRVQQSELPDRIAAWLARLTLLIGSLRVGYQIYRANPVEVADQVRGPVLFIHGEADPFVSTDEIESLVGRIKGPVEVWRVAGAGHRQAYEKHPDEYNRRVVAWFEKTLS